MIYERYFRLAAQLIVFVLFAAVIMALPTPTPSQSSSAIDSLNTQNLVHRRVKRQYFKPSIDGNILGNERRANTPMKTSRATNGELLSSSNTTTTATEINSNSPTSSSNSSIVVNGTSTSDKVEITVTSLSLSLINLFDRVKLTLCQIINQNCTCPIAV